MAGAPPRAHHGLTPERFAHLAIEAPAGAALAVAFRGREIVAVEMPDGTAVGGDPARALARRILESAGGIIVRFADAAPAEPPSFSMSVVPTDPPPPFEVAATWEVITPPRS